MGWIVGVGDKKGGGVEREFLERFKEWSRKGKGRFLAYERVALVCSLQLR